jgi:hypothetical protein
MLNKPSTQPQRPRKRFILNINRTISSLTVDRSSASSGTVTPDCLGCLGCLDRIDCNRPTKVRLSFVMISAKEVTMECVCLDNNEQPTLPPVTLYCLLSEPNLLISIWPTITITSLAEVFPVPLPILVPFLFLHFGLVSFLFLSHSSTVLCTHSPISPILPILPIPPIPPIPSGLAWTNKGQLVISQSEATSIVPYHTLQQGCLVSRRPGLKRLMVTCFHSPSLSGLDLRSPNMMFNYFQSNSPPRTMYGVVASSLVSQAGLLMRPECQADDPMLQQFFCCNRTICTVK